MKILNNINIRSITFGINLPNLHDNYTFNKFKELEICLDQTFSSLSSLVRTKRICFSPLNSFTNIELSNINSLLDSIDSLADNLGIRWYCLPFNFTLLPPNQEEKLSILYILKNYPKCFLNFIISSNNTFDFKSIYETSKIIKDISSIDSNGFANFRVGLSCNCKENTPFFPFSSHAGENGLSLALELTDLFHEIIDKSNSKNLHIIRSNIINFVSEKLSILNDSIRFTINKLGMDFEFKGYDLSLAPLPDGKTSVSSLIEKLGVDVFGANGTLFLTSYLTNIIKEIIVKSRVPTTGFNGVMYSLLEDSHLARRNNQNNFTIDSLLLYSVVCGCGLDMVPVPGNIFIEEIASMSMDIAILSQRLNKPLGIRVLPIPYKNAGEYTNFNSDFVTNTRVKEIKNHTFNF